MANKYYLIYRNFGQNFVKYKGNPIRLSTRLPYYVDEVVVGVKGQIGKERKITTFKDSDGNIIERIFDYYDKPLKNQIYTTREFIKGEDFYITTTSIKEYTIKKAALSVYKEYRQKFEELNILTALWDFRKIENNHLCENINTDEKIFSRSSITNIKQPTKEVHSFIEFPHVINRKRQGNSKKILQFRVNSKKDVTTNVLIQQNVKMPKKDSFLVFRALDFDEFKYRITKMFIKKRGLNRMDIGIEPEYKPPCAEIDRLSAEFNAGNGQIYFNKFYKFKSKPKLISTCRHEVEHGWQYYLDARNTGGKYSWQMEIAKKFGQIRSKKLKKEAERYSKAIKNYVPYYENYEKYKKNLIEIKANKAGTFEKNNYENQAQEIRQEFPFIPEEML